MVLRKTLFLIIPFVLLLVATPVFGATLKGGEDVSIQKTQSVKDDLYIAGGNVTVLGTVAEDLISAGGNILLNSTIGGDALAAGGSVQVLAPVGDDIRLAGGQILVGDRVGGDAVIAGGDIKLLSGSSVGGDVIIAGGRVILDGTVLGGIQVWAEELVVNGSISGDVSFKGAKLTFGEDARVLGAVNYTSPNEAIVSESATLAGEVVFDQKEVNKKTKQGAGFFFALGGAFLVGKIALILITTIVAVLLFRRFAVDLSTEALKSFGRNTLLAFAVLVATPIALLILASTFFGILIAGIGLTGYVLTIMIAKVFSGVVAGALLSKWIKKEMIVDWKWAALGVIALQIVSIIPMIGWIVPCVLFLVTFGAIITIAYEKFWINR